MKQRFRIALSIFTAIWLSGCEALVPTVAVLGAEAAAWNYLLSGPGQPFISETEINADELKSVKTIALLEIPDTSGYGDFGLEFGEFSFRSTTDKFLKRHLEESGFKVIDLPADRKNSLHLKDNYLGLDSEVADAYLDVVSVRIAYVTTGLTKYSDDGFGPHVAVALRLVSAVGKKVIYAGNFQYGWSMNQSVSGIKIESPEGHRFERFEAIEEQKEEAIRHFEYGIEAISASIVKKISKGKFNSVMRSPIEDVLEDSDADSPPATSETMVKPPFKQTGVYDLSGTYFSTITGTNAQSILGISPEVKLTQKGKKVSGTFGTAGGHFWGEIEDGIIRFKYRSSDGGSGTGKWTVEPDSGEITGKWSSTTWLGSGIWNLTRIE